MQRTLTSEPLDYDRKYYGVYIFVCGAFFGGRTQESQATLLQSDVTALNESEDPTSDLFLI